MDAKAAMWVKLGVLVASTGAILAALFAPMKTVSIRVNMPAGSPTGSGVQFLHAAQLTVWAAAAAMAAAVLLIAGLIGRGIIRLHRRD